MRRFFGTDGVRSEANKGPMRPESILKIAMAAGLYFKAKYPIAGNHHPTVVIGKDTRLSGYMVESALQAGFISVGIDVLLLGPIPTPAVSLLTRSFRAQFGVMISASHNPAKDNGIKFFGPDGDKLTDEDEKQIESLFFQNELTLSDSYDLGKAKRVDDASGRYLEFIKSSFPRGLRLDGMKIVVDCANGSAYKIAQRLYWELGADVVALHADPNGLNINKDCGATHVHDLQKKVIEHSADIGFALDGDADRLIAVDENGTILDGDQILCVIAMQMKKDGLLNKNTLVATHMSNLGMEKYLKEQGIDLVRTAVGDRYVHNEMKNNDYNLGGEQSGHVIIGNYSSTGDGLMTSLQLLKIMLKNNMKASDLGQMFTLTPQRLVNIKQSKEKLNTPYVQKEIKEAQNQLSEIGRIFIRPSGTEDLIRVMVEADEHQAIENALEKVLKALNHS